MPPTPDHKPLIGSILLVALLIGGTLWIIKQPTTSEDTVALIEKYQTPKAPPTEEPPVDGLPGYVSKSAPYPETHTIALEHLGLSFKIPAGYSAYQREVFEGGYSTEVFIGKEVAPGHYKNAGVQISIFLSERTPGNSEKYYSPIEYGDALFKELDLYDGFHARHINLLGNRAIHYFSEIDDNPVIIGYIRLSEDYQGIKDLGLKISGSTYGSGAHFDQRLFDQVVSSLTLNKNTP